MTTEFQVIMLLLLFLNLFTGMDGGCPIRCDCTENSINCMSRKLEYIPFFEGLDNNPTIIDLSGNTINYIDIDDFSFDKSDQVLEVYLNSSQLASIEDKSFDELEKLQELYLGENFLNDLPDSFVEHNENLIILDLSSNYFVDMPKINSESLEVLAIANSGIHRVPIDALSGLINLRLLLIQENNLKTLDPGVFDTMPNFFFVKLVHNPWQCTCKTIRLFNYLSNKKIVDVTEGIQCQTEDKIFVDVYNKGILSKDFANLCSGVTDAELIQNEKQIQQAKTALENSQADDSFYPEVSVTRIVDNEVDHFTNFFYSVILCSTIVLSLFVGAVLGSCLTYKYISRNVRQTQSLNQLLPKTNEFVA